MWLPTLSRNTSPPLQPEDHNPVSYRSEKLKSHIHERIWRRSFGSYLEEESVLYIRVSTVNVENFDKEIIVIVESKHNRCTISYKSCKLN
jgi:hypothetical protein